MSRRIDRGDEGQVLLLALVGAVIAIALVAVVTSATAVHLARHRLQALADAAALDAADAIDPARFYARGAAPGAAPVPLTDASVQAAATTYLAATDASTVRQLPGLAVAPPTGTPDGITAEVTLVATAPVPLVGSVLEAWSDGVPLSITSRAKAVSS